MEISTMSYPCNSKPFFQCLSFHADKYLPGTLLSSLLTIFVFEYSGQHVSLIIKVETTSKKSKDEGHMTLYVITLFITAIPFSAVGSLIPFMTS